MAGIVARIREGGPAATFLIAAIVVGLLLLPLLAFYLGVVVGLFVDAFRLVT